MSKRPATWSAVVRTGRGEGGPGTSVRPTVGSVNQQRSNKPNASYDGGTRGHSATGEAATTSQQEDALSLCAVARFEEACEKIRKTTEIFLDRKDNCEVYSSSDDDDDDDYNDRNTSILNKVLSPYSQLSMKNEMGRTEGFLMDSIKSGANTCLICLSSIKKTEAIWACSGCYCSFHLPCIQTWARDSIQQEQSKHSFTSHWCCPKCRYEYNSLDCPTKYACYCGKVLDPTFDPWLIAHTCGQTCDGDLRPFCGHKCLLLCHPGPCPPCPKMVHISCHCGRQKVQARRCSSQLWSCGKPCGNRLSCGQHQCKRPCHEGECSPCQKTSVQSCFCRKEKINRPCADPTWHCSNKCSLPLSCGHHKCEEVCHAGQCSVCPRSKERSCPCGKNKCNLPCTQDISACGDTCGKPLACGIHNCAQRCHAGACGTCVQMSVKACRCSQKTKSLPCHKEYFCDIKCKAIKNCGRHLCNRKCCDGNCPLCEQLCGRTLRCRNHKCNSPCHQGPCYPCPLMVQVACRCGATVSNVPCGTEKGTAPPKCSVQCKIRPVCDHNSHVPPHRCHFDLCPPCRQPCNKMMPCGHKCPQRCHINVLTKVEVEQTRAGPWEAKIAPRMQYVSRPCPPCKFPVSVTCLGKHRTRDFPCSQATPSPCDSKCGRKLLCGNHGCALACHSVTDAVSETSAGSNCAPCEVACSLPRPEGCPHPCLKFCHRTPCPPCRQMIQQRCLCGLNRPFIPCIKWTSTSAVKSRRVLLSCGNQCPKSMRCGHRCALLCHDGPCSPPEECEKKMTFKCECKRLKKEVVCSAVQARSREEMTVHCDAICVKKQESERKVKSAAEVRQQREEMQKNEDEVEKLRRRLEGKRARKPRTKERGECDAYTFREKYGMGFVLLGVLFGFILVALYFLLGWWIHSN